MTSWEPEVTCFGRGTADQWEKGIAGSGNRKSRVLGWETADQLGKRDRGLRMGQNRGEKRAQSPKSNFSIGGGPWTQKKKTPCWKKKRFIPKLSVTSDCLTKSSNPDDRMGVLTGKLKMLFIRGMTWLLLAMSLTDIHRDKSGN